MMRRAWVVLAVLWPAFGCRDHGATSNAEPEPNGGAGGGHQVACATTYLTQDRDGDGVAALWQVGCGEETPQAAYSGATDCDDRDPAVFQRAWVDADGDGWTVGQGRCVGALAPGLSGVPTLHEDCDDHDPSVHDSVFEDADGDNFGAAKRCIAGVPPAHGISLNAGDCDDQDAHRHPGAFEQWRDGVDSDCNGQDDPLQCDEQADSGLASDTCGCELLTTTNVAIDPQCLGTDLVLVKQATCEDCLERNMVVVGNRGTVATSAGFDLFVGDVTSAIHVNANLAPGAVSLPLVLRGSGKALVIHEAAACHGDAHGSLDYVSYCLTP